MAPKNVNETSLEGMIRASNNVLDKALDPERICIPRGLFQRCVGIVVLPCIYEAGLVFSRVNGTGVIVAKKEDGTWSNPSAVELLGVDFGSLAGFQQKDVIIFITDKNTMHALSGQGQTKLGGRAGVTGAWGGREADVSMFLAGKEGVGGAFSYSIAEEGVFGGLSLGGSVLKSLDYANHQFYGEKVSPREILCLDINATQHDPADDSEHSGASQDGPKANRGTSEISDLHAKLRLLAAGEEAEESSGSLTSTEVSAAHHSFTRIAGMRES